VVEPYLDVPAGELPAIFRLANSDQAQVLCAQIKAPEKASIRHYKDQGLTLVPGSGLLATVIPGAFDGWMLLLRDYGAMTLEDVFNPAIYYAENGHPLLPGAARVIASLKEFFEAEWPTSAVTWLPGGIAPEAGKRFCNPVLAQTWWCLLSEVEYIPDREDQIEAARKCWSDGFISQAIDRFIRKTELKDASGLVNRGVLTGEDMQGWRASYEAPVIGEYAGWSVAKTGPWGRGQVCCKVCHCCEGLNWGDLIFVAPTLFILSVRQ
jgi:gamma-glutamyltranspeptidase/glutathione hydrolase